MATQAQQTATERRLSGLEQNPTVSIAGREISERFPPYIVAEISCNHSGSINKAKDLIASAKWAGADAVKLQTYTPAELTTREHPEMWALYEKAHTPREWHAELFEFSRDRGITIFSSAFSVEGVKFLQALGSPAIKIASADISDHALVEGAINTGLPVIISTGMANPWKDLRDPGGDLRWPWAIYLHCVSKYPSAIKDANLSAIRILQAMFYSKLVGLSDHTPGYETAIAATALGAVMIEKHIKTDNDCIDAAWSLHWKDFAKMCKAVRAIWEGMGDGVIRPTGEPRKR